MKIRYLVVILIAVAIGVFIALRPRKPKSLKEQVSYTIGAKFGASLRAQKFDLRSGEVEHGFDDGLKADNLLLSDEEMQAAIKTVADKQQQDIAAQAEKNKGVAQSFFEKNKNAPGVKITASGLQYKMVEEGKGPQPKPQDVVVIKFKNYIADDKAPEPAFAPETQADVAVSGVIPGWSEGLQLMQKGGKAIFYVPPELGYGDRPMQGIPANATQVFQVELLDVKPGNPPNQTGKKTAVKSKSH
jgi:FKBP-type peptidyl-prolyl cis-trans isomerase